MNIEFHQTNRFLTGAGSLLNSVSGGATARCAATMAADTLLGKRDANLAFCRDFLSYRAVFIKNSFGGMFLLAGAPDWPADDSIPLFDSGSYLLKHELVMEEPTAEWVDKWVACAFKDKLVKVAILSQTNQSLLCAFMRDNDEFTIIAGEADESKIKTE